MVINKESKDRLGQWSSIQIGKESRIIKIITFYRIANNTVSGLLAVHTQYS